MGFCSHTPATLEVSKIQPMWSWSTNVTDRRTDKRTDGRTTCNLNTALCTGASHGNDKTTMPTCRLERAVVLSVRSHLKAKARSYNSGEARTQQLISQASSARHWRRWSHTKDVLHII